MSLPIKLQKSLSTYLIYGLGLLLWLAFSWFSVATFQTHRIKQVLAEKTGELNEQADILSASIRQKIQQLHGIPELVAQDANVLRALARRESQIIADKRSVEERKNIWSSSLNLNATNHYLNHVASALGTEILFVLNARGDCIASSNIGMTDSFIGTNYSNREFFKQSRAGKPGSQYALGKVSNKPGLYLSAPILDHGHILGVAVVKLNLRSLSHWIDQSEAFITDQYGVIIMAKDASLELQSLADRSVMSLTVEERLSRYKRADFPVLKIEHSNTGQFNYFPIAGVRSPVLLTDRDLGEGHSRVHLLMVSHRLKDYQNEIGWIFLFVFLSGIGLFVAMKLRLSSLQHREQAKQKLLNEIELRKQMMEALPGVFYMIDQSGHFLSWNKNLEKITQHSAQEMQQLHPLDLFAPNEKEMVATRIAQTFENGGASVEARIVAKDGGSIPFYLTGLRIELDGQPVLIGTGVDITEHKISQQRIEQLAHFDSLTGLPNRTLLNDRIKHALVMSHRSNQPLALLFLDLDHFKNINDTLGHSIGDQLLAQIAKRLVSVMREEDTVSRLGGDEFVMVLPDSKADGAAHVAEKLLEVVAQPFQLEQFELMTTPSIGIAMYPVDGQDFEVLLRCADVAMYRAKSSGRNTFRFFTPEMQAHSARNLQLGSALRRALELGQFHLSYQPQVELQDGRVIGAEALLRWDHPYLGAISPAEFVPIAEDSGLILNIGEWVMRTATRQLKQWMSDGMSPITMAVNLSAVQFRNPQLPELVTRILNEAGLPANQFELELTERVTMDNPASAIAMMNKLHELGVRMSIDDFGSGYSSLSHLKRFQVYKLKIDQSFVREITVDPEDKAIVSAIISLANSLNIQVIAEGVETAGQLAFLRLQGCSEVQRYYFSKPLPADEFAAFVRNRN
jgi:diguanylate cyclase (GGDEF)-like protein/PAS domain S-box-containing protein